jgi:putative sterol carrier protein
MATLAACRAAVQELAGQLAAADDDIRKHVEDRTVSLRLADLDAMLTARLTEGHLVDVSSRALPEPAQIRLTCSSDDLLELVNGTLNFPHAWATGRLKINASLRDLYKLRTLVI